MNETARKELVDYPTEIPPGQKAFIAFPLIFTDEAWSQFVAKNQSLYVFGELRFTDELSDGRDVIVQICVRPDQTLNVWYNCARGQNRTIRP